MVQVAHGRLSKQIPCDIRIAEATVKDASQPSDAQDEGRSRPELSRMAGKLKLVPEGPQHS